MCGVTFCLYNYWLIYSICLFSDLAKALWKLFLFQGFVYMQPIVIKLYTDIRDHITHAPTVSGFKLIRN